MPGRKQISRRVISRFWEQLRTPLQLEKELKFYSLRDSGIIEKIRNGIDLITVMQLADHSSLEITNAYVKLASRDANKEAMKKF